MSATTPTTTTAAAKVIHTIKLVVIGASGVGKTSLRGQYISGRFTSGYRATIGTDFIAKTLSHPTKPEQNVTLQIWDTAGQERFSSLSTAFFRGADAVLLMFDIHQDESLDALQKWWAEFCEGLPLLEEDMLEYPCFVVGNKIDLVADDEDEDEDEDDGDRVSAYRGTRVSGNRIQRFLDELIPNHQNHNHNYSSDDDDDGDGDGVSSDSPPPSAILQTNGTPTTATTPAPTSPIIQVQKSPSIDIKSTAIEDTRPKPSQDHTRLRSESTSQFNTISSINSTTTSVYLTPSSSLFSNTFHTARSSPEASLSSSSSLSPLSSPTTPTLPPPQGMITPAVRQRRLTSLSSGSASSESAATITPSNFAQRERQGTINGRGGNSHNSTSNGTTTTKLTTPNDTPGQQQQQQQPPPPLPLPPPQPDRGPSLHFTSAKTGEGVRELFEHVAERVMKKLEYEDYYEARRMHYREASGAETIRLGMGMGSGSGSEVRVSAQKWRYERCCT